MGRKRADALMVEQGLAPTRTRARALILAGVVLEEGRGRVDKPGTMLADSSRLHLKEQPLPYVSRGGLKLAAALDEFNVSASGKICMDVGASTGGFTDCLLQRGARRIFAVDVGYGQLAWQLRQDLRVVVLERANIRTLAVADITEPIELFVIDVSFISLRLVLPAALRFAARPCEVVALVKPQFEVGRQHVGKGGIVRDEAARQSALQAIVGECAELGLANVRTMDSPILGAKGNHEFLIHANAVGIAAPIS